MELVYPESINAVFSLHVIEKELRSPSGASTERLIGRYI
jgi:hypothetical protein